MRYMTMIKVIRQAEVQAGLGSRANTVHRRRH